MKIALKTLLLSAIVAGFATSCTKEYVTKEEYITENHYDGAQIFTREYTINPDQWTLEHYDDGRPYFLATVDNPDITNQVMDHGVVLGYIWYTYNIEIEGSSWNALPYVFPLYLESENAIVPENIRMEYENGLVYFVIEDLDRNVPELNGSPLIFKVAVIKNIK